MKRILLLSLIFLTKTLYAQVPANDECATATLLTPATSCSPVSGTLSNATTSTVTTGCSGYNDVFYKFVATSTDVDITLAPSATLDPKLSIFSTCGSTYLSCVDLGNAGDSEVAYINNLTVGTTYYIKVANYTSTLPTAPTFSICVKTVVRPLNDECAGAITLTPGSTCNVTTGTFFQASTSTTTGGCGGTFDVFYKFVATSSSASIIATPSTGTDIRYALSTSCGSGSALVCVNNAASGAAENQTIDNLTVGTTYFIKLSTGNSVVPTSPAFTICVQNQPVPAIPSNNECSGATTLVQSSTCSATQGTLLGATTSTITPSCIGYKDVFYKFVATATSANIEVTSSAGLDATVSVHNTCGGPSLYCINNASNGGVDKLIVGSLVVGTTYYIKVASSVFAPSTNTFTVCVLSVPRPVNDECSGATSLTPSSTCNTTSGSLLNASPSNILATCASGTSDVFYKFVAASTAVSIGVTPSTGIDPVVSAFSSCGGSSIGCVDNGASGTPETLTLTGLTIGVTYYIQVQNYGSSSPSTPDFTICVQNIVLNVPANDECVNAITLTPSTTCAPTTGTILNATTSTITPSCTGYYDVFYKFVANATTATVTGVGSAGLDLKLSAFAACGGTNLDCVDGDFNQGGTETMALTSLIIGNTYYIKVANWTATESTTSTFTICVVSTPSNAPVNNECANAITLTQSTTCTPTTGTIANATTSTITPSCTGYYDVFYKFVANTTSAAVTAVGSSGLDLKLSAFAACGGANIACIDAANQGGTETMALTSLIVGNTYYIKVSNYTSTVSSTFTFTICVANITPPANDACANAITLTPSTTCTPISGTFVNATNSGVTNSCSGNTDVFYKFVANATTATVTSVPNGSADVILSVMPSCSSTTSLVCVDDQSTASATEVASLTGLTIGSTYFVKIQNFNSSVPPASSFSVCVASSSVTTATQSSTALNSISLYPNPTQNVLNIENVSMDTKIELIDLTGKTILVQDLSADTQVDLSNYSAGVYILKLTSGGVSENRRVVLSK